MIGQIDGNRRVFAPPLLTAAWVQGGYHVSGVDLAPEQYATAARDLGLAITACHIETKRLPRPGREA